MVRALCAADDCSEPLPKGRRKWHSNACRDRMNKRQQRARERQEAGREPRRDVKPLDKRNNLEFLPRELSRDGRGPARGGPKYEAFVASGWAEEIALGHATPSEAADALGERPGSVSRWMANYVEQKANAALASDWTMPVDVANDLDDYAAFCRRFWPDHKVPPFAAEWGDLITDALDTGGRLLLLAAQRHSKTESLIKYCVWRICRNPDIKIIWISQSQDLAKKAVGYILDILTTHDELIEQVLGPGREFRPPTRQNMSWTSEEFTVGVRSKPAKSPTMVAIGKGGSLLSRDADLIVCDDLQEHKHIRSPSMREKDVDWFFTDLMSRKMPDTGLAVIGSRQHVDDIYKHILDRSDQWTVKVYPVHDPACTLPPDDVAAHVDCMLWPEQYSYSYMQEQRAQQGEAYFQRNMMNDPKADQLVFVTSEDIGRRMDPEFMAGEVPAGARLVAGIDPASSKPTAASLWAHRKGKRYLVDVMLASPGNKGAREILETFHGTYGCFRFIVEQNGYQGEIMQDAEVRAMIAGLGLQVAGHYTSRVNKWNEASGVVKFLHSIRAEDSPIVLPSAGDKEVLERLEQAYRQWAIFDPDYVNHKHADDDLVMACWFPQLQMDKWDTSDQIVVVGHDQQTGYASTTYGQRTGW